MSGRHHPRPARRGMASAPLLRMLTPPAPAPRGGSLYSKGGIILTGWAGWGKGIPFSHSATRPRHAALSATAASPPAAKCQSPLSAPSEQRAPTCSQHPQLTDRSGPPSTPATPADWLLPASFSCSLHSEWFRRPPLQVRARPSPGAGSSLTTRRVQLRRRYRLSPDRSLPGAFGCHSQGTLRSDWLRLWGRGFPSSRTPIGSRLSRGGGPAGGCRECGRAGAAGRAMGSVRWAFPCGAWRPRRREWLLAAQLVQPEEKERIGQFVFARDAKAALVHGERGRGCL